MVLNRSHEPLVEAGFQVAVFTLVTARAWPFGWALGVRRLDIYS